MRADTHIPAEYAAHRGSCRSLTSRLRAVTLWLFPVLLSALFTAGLLAGCESEDDGLTWGEVYLSELPNPGAGLDGVVLASGRWLLIYNDATRGRNSLAVSLSEDEGRTWTFTRHLEQHDSGSYHYPAVIQGRDGTIHTVYSYFVNDGGQEGKSMKHAAINEAWIIEGDE